VECLRTGSRSLEPFEGQISEDIDEVVPDAEFIDPSRPYDSQFLPPDHRLPARRQVVLSLAGLLALVFMAAFWQWAPIREHVNVLDLAGQLQVFAQGPLAAPVTIAGFLVGGLLVMPVLLLIAVTILAFGPWWGFLYAFIGMTVSALLTFWIGRLLGRRLMDRLAGTRLHHVSRMLASKGVLAVVTLRIVPLAPFSIINAIAGATHIRLRDFVVGTVLGELPGLVSLALFVDQIYETIRHPGPGSIGMLALLAGTLVLAGWGLRRWLKGVPAGGASASRP
jgi:phospholipase D1/2